jgi:hypothetical protein
MGHAKVDRRGDYGNIQVAIISRLEEPTCRWEVTYRLAIEYVLLLVNYN